MKRKELNAYLERILAFEHCDEWDAHGAEQRANTPQLEVRAAEPVGLALARS